MSLTFITGVKFYKNVIDMINHVTFIYDVNWSPDNSVKATFPVCFFHVKNMHEVSTAEVSQKPMLFYNSNSGADESTVKLDSGLLNVVADNIVIKPKTYKLDVIIPYQDLSLLNQSFIFNTETMQAITETLLKTGGKLSNLSSWSTLSQPVVAFFKDLLKTLLLRNMGSSTSAFIDSVMNQPDYNKNSLDVMFQLRRILKMKMWNSWEYKYVAITDLDITKEGTEDGVYEATMTVQEMPIVTIRDRSFISSKFEYKNKMIQAQGDKTIELLNGLEVKQNQ